MSNKKVLLGILVGFLIVITSTLMAMILIKLSYHKDFTQECYRACYYNKDNTLWEYRPWGYGTEFIEEDRDFPQQSHCLNYCLSQKEIDFIQ